MTETAEAAGMVRADGRARYIRAPAAPSATVPRELLEPVAREHMRHVERDLAAYEVDRWLRVLGRQEGLCRSAFGRLAAVFLRQQAQHRLGFGRVGDYARERLGISGRELQTAARVVTALTTLPHLASAFDAGELSWTQLRILVTVATPATEDHWLDLARGRTVRALGMLAAEPRAATGAPARGMDAAEFANAESARTGNAGSGKGEADRIDARDGTRMPRCMPQPT